MSNNSGQRIGSSGFVAATVSVSLVLLMLGSVAYLLINANRSSDGILSGVGFSIMLKDNITQTQRDEIETQLSGSEAIVSYEYLSREEAAREFKSYVGIDFESLLDGNPLPASYELILNPEFTTLQAMQALEDKASSWEGVDDVIYQKKMTQMVSDTLKRINLILLSLGSVLLIVSILLIYNTLKLAVASHRYSIRTMKLVGAKSSFIRRPFMLGSLTQGAIAGVISSIALYVLIDTLSTLIPAISFVREWPILILLFCAMIVTGIAICAGFTFISVNKYIKLSDKL